MSGKPHMYIQNLKNWEEFYEVKIYCRYRKNIYIKTNIYSIYILYIFYFKFEKNRLGVVNCYLKNAA